MNWFEGIGNWFQGTQSKNWSGITGDVLERTKSVNWSGSAQDLLENTKNVKWSERTKDFLDKTKSVNWSESTKDLLESAKNTSWYESAGNLCESGKNLLGRAIDFAKENVEVRHLVIGGVALVLVVAVIRGCGSGGGSNGGKTMKAPGGKGRIIYRDGFERNPRGYFRGLRNKKT